MAQYYFIPSWFYGFDSTLELLFGIITLIVAIFSYKIYNISKERKIRNFSLGFFLISFSYIIWAVLNISLIQKVAKGVSFTALLDINNLWKLGLAFQMLFLIAGLAMLVYSVLDVKKGGIYYLLLGLSLTAIVASVERIITFRIVSLFLLSFIAYHYLWEYIENKNKTTLKVMFAFILLFISNLDMAFAPRYSGAFVAGHIIELIAYALILTTMAKTLKKKK